MSRWYGIIHIESKDSMQNLWRLPKERYNDFKTAYDVGNWLWLISIWNEYKVTDVPICAGCPSSIDTVSEGFEKWFGVVEKEAIK